MTADMRRKAIFITGMLLNLNKMLRMKIFRRISRGLDSTHTAHLIEVSELGDALPYFVRQRLDGLAVMAGHQNASRRGWINEVALDLMDMPVWS